MTTSMFPLQLQPLGGVAHLVQEAEQRGEQVGVVGGAAALQRGHQPLQTHPRVHAGAGQPPQATVRLPGTHRPSASGLLWVLVLVMVLTHLLYCMKTRFQISTTSGPSALTSGAAFRPPTWS